MVNPTENLINARLLSNMKTRRISTFLVQNVFVKSLRRAYRKKIIFQLILELKFVSVHVGKTNASFSMTIKKWVCFGTHNDRSVGISFLSTDEKSPIWNDQKSFTLKSLNFRGPELFYMSFQNEWLTFIVTSRSPFNIGLAYVGVSHKLRFLQFISDGVRAKISKSAQVVWERKLGVYSVIWKVLTAKKRGKGLKPKKNVKK